MDNVDKWTKLSAATATIAQSVQQAIFYFIGQCVVCVCVMLSSVQLFTI